MGPSTSPCREGGRSEWRIQEQCQVHYGILRSVRSVCEYKSSKTMGYTPDNYHRICNCNALLESRRGMERTSFSIYRTLEVSITGLQTVSMFRFLAIRSTAERIDIQDHLAARLDIQAHVIQRLLVSAGVPSFCQMESHPNAVNWNIPVPVVLHMPITLECRQLECLSHRSDLSCKRQGDVLLWHFRFEFQPSCCTHLVQASRGSAVYP